MVSLQKPSQNEFDLHRETHECGVVRYLLNVVHCQADEEVHDDDGHGEDEKDEKEEGECWEGHVGRALDATVRHVVSKNVREVHFAEHHDERFYTGEAGVRESGLLEWRPGLFNQGLLSHVIF